jgi:TetR/AcrR family transcriptional regulator
MVLIAHSGVNEDKIAEILLAAQKRFGILGYSKTTMHEIAEDLGISKASLYYYYPDKDNLFCAVFEKEKQEFIDQLHETINKSDDAKLLLNEFINMRMTNFKSLVNLGRASLEDLKGMKMVLKDLWIRFREKEQEEIKQIFVKGNKSGQFQIKDKDELANLFLDSLRGLSHIYLRSKEISYLNDEEFRKLDKQIRHFTDIFIKGISA